MNRLLVVDDKLNIQRVLKMILEKQGYAVETASSGTEGLSKIIGGNPDLVVSDIRMEDMSGTELFQMVRSRGMNVPFIFITAFGSVQDAVAAMKNGAVDYLTKPIDYAQLQRSIAAMLHGQQGRKIQQEKRQLLGSSTVMRNLHDRIRAVAESSATVLITGESGTGKELVARAIFEQSRRADRPFVAVNCSAFSMPLLESELFGHEKGAFTGAEEQKKGVFEIADGGTLLLDEASEMAPATQVKLLRVLQERCLTRVGGTETVPIDVRLIAATNRNLEELTAKGSFRKDLFYRLNVVPIFVPPLRDHLEDIDELVRYFVGRISRREQIDPPGISEGFIRNLYTRKWTGNVRELENLVERVLILYRPRFLEAEHLEAELPYSGPTVSTSPRERIIDALRLCGGNKTEAAKVLAIPRRTLYYKLEQYSIDKSEYRSV